jgi:hypothetical protein
LLDTFRNGYEFHCGSYWDFSFECLIFPKIGDRQAEREYCYNPLHNNLDSSALAYSVASLLNNLYGRGKEPFWQRAYTNMLQHIILLHKVLFDYVTFFDVYECAISPPKLEKRIEEAKSKFQTREYICVTPEVYGNEQFGNTFSEFSFVYDERHELYKATSQCP